MDHLLTDATRRRFSAWLSDVPRGTEGQVQHLASKVREAYVTSSPSANFMKPARLMRGLFDAEFGGRSAQDRARLQRALASSLALTAPARIAEEGIPTELHSYCREAFDRMAEVIEQRSDDTFFRPAEQFARLTLVATVPAGAEVFDLRSRVPITSLILSAFRMTDVRPLWRYARCGGWGVWFRSHTDTAYLEEFNQEGWNRYYLRIAKMLRLRPHVRGLVGTSWFYDPRVKEITPRLGYLQRVPLAAGAILFKHRSTAFDIKNATARSATRRRLYERGDYQPTAYTIAWPRKELLNWANRVAEPGGDEEPY